MSWQSWCGVTQLATQRLVNVYMISFGWETQRGQARYDVIWPNVTLR